MRKLLSLSLSAAFLLGFTLGAAAAEPREIIDKAIKAHGGAEKLGQKAERIKTKGRLEIMGGLAFTSEAAFQLPDKFKETVELNINGQNFTVVTGYNGKDAWITTNGQAVPLPGLKDEFKEAANAMQVGKLIYLKDKKYELSPLGEVNVNEKPAEGVKVTAKGQRDINLYFDKKSGLLVKVEHQVHDFMANQDVNEERIILEYMDQDGNKVPKKVLINRDGKKYLEAEVIEVKELDEIDSSEFAKP
jgi:hypothetical protein